MVLTVRSKMPFRDIGGGGGGIDYGVGKGKRVDSSQL